MIVLSCVSLWLLLNKSYDGRLVLLLWFFSYSTTSLSDNHWFVVDEPAHCQLLTVTSLEHDSILVSYTFDLIQVCPVWTCICLLCASDTIIYFYCLTISIYVCLFNTYWSMFYAPQLLFLCAMLCYSFCLGNFFLMSSVDQAGSVFSLASRLFLTINFLFWIFTYNKASIYSKKQVVSIQNLNPFST